MKRVQNDLVGLKYKVNRFIKKVINVMLFVAKPINQFWTKDRKDFLLLF